MEYYISTDGSCRADLNKCGSAYIVLTKKTYVSAGCETILSSYAFEAELYAVIMSLRALKDNVTLNRDDTVLIYVDSVKTLRLCNDIIAEEENEDAKVPMYSTIKRLLLEYNSYGVNVEFIKVKAHRDTFNTNKVVDRLSKVAITHFQAKAWV